MPRKQKTKREKVRLTVEQKQEAKEAFDLYDVDGSGEIDEHELLLAFKSLGFDSKPAEVRKMLSLYDTDGNGEFHFVQDGVATTKCLQQNCATRGGSLTTAYACARQKGKYLQPGFLQT